MQVIYAGLLISTAYKHGGDYYQLECKVCHVEGMVT